MAGIIRWESREGRPDVELHEVEEAEGPTTSIRRTVADRAIRSGDHWTGWSREAASYPSDVMGALRLSMVVAMAMVTVACATGTGDDAETGPVGTLLAKCPTVVDSDGQGSLTVSVSNATLVESDPMVLAVAVDGSTVLCEAVMQGEPDTYTDFTVPVSRELHEATVEVWADGDPEDEFHLRSFSTSRDVDPVETPFLVVERRHAPPEAAVVYVRAIDHPPG